MYSTHNVQRCFRIIIYFCIHKCPLEFWRFQWLPCGRWENNLNKLVKIFWNHMMSCDRSGTHMQFFWTSGPDSSCCNAQGIRYCTLLIFKKKSENSKNLSNVLREYCVQYISWYKLVGIRPWSRFLYHCFGIPGPSALLEMFLHGSQKFFFFLSPMRKIYVYIYEYIYSLNWNELVYINCLINAQHILGSCYLKAIIIVIIFHYAKEWMHYVFW